MPYITSVAETASASIHRSKNIPRQNTITKPEYLPGSSSTSRRIMARFSHQQIVAFSNQVGSAWVTFFN